MLLCASQDSRHPYCKRSNGSLLQLCARTLLMPSAEVLPEPAGKSASTIKLDSCHAWAIRRGVNYNRALHVHRFKTLCGSTF